LGSIQSNKVKFVSKCADGTSVTTSQEIFHSAPAARGGTIGGPQIVSKLAMKFKKCDGLRLEKFEADTSGTIKAAIACSSLAPGVNLSFGADTKAVEGKGDAAGKLGASNALHATLTYSHSDLLCSTHKLDFLNKTLTSDAMIGYESFLLGGKFNLSEKKKAYNLVAGMNSGAHRFAVEACNPMANNSSFNLSGYIVPAKGVEVGIMSTCKMTGTDKKDGEWGTKMSGSVSGCFSLDDAGTSLTTTVSTEDELKTFNVGLSYTQMVRNWARVTASGEVGITNVDHVAFGLELELGNI